MNRQLGAGPFFATGALLASVVGLVVWTADPPPVRDKDAPPELFSAARARVDLESLVNLGPRPLRPRDQTPVPAHAQGRQALIKRFFELGMTPQIQIGELLLPSGKVYQVENVIGRLEPSSPSTTKSADAVVLLSHYDSVGAGPGAGDAASGTAAVLEITRALKQSTTRRRPLIVVIDDGEEVGLLGAKLFLSHPWVAEVGVVLNFEARGTSGQTAMFETSDRSAWLVEKYGKAAARPVASSVIYSLYRMLPNNTDLTLVKEAGLHGLNFAFADEDWNYHTARDDLFHLDLRSVQHMGDQGLAVARALVEQAAPLPSHPPADADAVWFDLFNQHLVVYRDWVAKGLAGLLFMAYLAALALYLRRRGGSAASDGLLRFFATLCVLLLTGVLVQKLIALIASSPRPWRQRPLPTFLALVAAAIAAGGGVQWLMDRWQGRRSSSEPCEVALGQALGGLFPHVAVSLFLTLAVVGTSYPFTLPALAVALPIVALLKGPLSQKPLTATRLWAALLPGLLCMAILWFPLMRVVRVMVGAQVSFAVTLPVALCLGYYDPLMRLCAPRWRGVVPIAAGIGMIVAIAIAASGSS